MIKRKQLPLRSTERGSVVVVALLFAMTVMGLAAAVISSALAAQNQRRYYVAAQRAQSAAESGVHHMLAALSGPGGVATIEAGRLSDIVQGIEGSTRSVGYVVTVVRGESDGVDNDSDGSVDEPDEADLLEITSTGRADNVVRTVRVTAGARQVALPSAVYVSDPSLRLEFDEYEGGSFSISGADVGLNGFMTGAAVPGIGVQGDPAPLIRQIPPALRTRITGSGGTPSIERVPTVDPSLLQELIEAAQRMPHVRLTENTRGPLGTVERPAIVIGRGELELEGRLRGVGLLILMGEELELEGRLEWTGLVIIRAGEEMEMEEGALRVRGGVIIDRSGGDDDDDGIEFEEATVAIEYSREAVALATRQFRTYHVLSWRDAPNPEERP